MSSKRVKITPSIEAKIRSAVGDPALDTGNFAVYEARAISTQPIKQSGFYNGAVFTHSTLGQMADLINTAGKALPLLVMHDNEMTPVGKVFSGKLMDTGSGYTELRVQFYVPLDKTQLISDIDNALIDEVSVGVLTNQALCSECEFDYFGPDGGFMSIMTQTCGNGHVIGEDGVHVRATGLKDWGELSLVGRGAAKDAKILTRAKQAMSQDSLDRLAASGTPMDARIVMVTNKLEASASDNNSKGDLSMDKETLALFQAKSDEVATLKAELSTAATVKTGLETQVATLTATNESLTTEVANLKAANTEGATLAAKVTEVEAKLKDAAEKLIPHAKAALTASGVADADLPTDVSALLALIETKGLKLHQVFGADPKTIEAKAGVQDSETGAEYRNEAFKTKN